MYNGKPVSGGTITFHPKDGGGAFTVGLAGDGTYSAYDVRHGECTVTVETETINPDRKQQEYKGGSGPGIKYGGGKFGPGAGQQSPGGKASPKSPMPEGTVIATTYIKIPPKYGKPDSSGLSVTLKKGEQTHNFELTD
jgi:hypothetical protein